MKMVDMKREKPKRAETTQTAKMPEPFYEKYPYGLRLTLHGEELKKLGLKAKDFTVDMEGDLSAKFKVFTVRDVQNSSVMGRGIEGDSQSVEIQIVSLGLGKLTENEPGKFAMHKAMMDKEAGE